MPSGRILWGDLEWASLVCAAHRLQNAIKDALDKKQLCNLLARCRRLVGHMKHSALKTTQLAEKQALLGIVPAKKVIQDCPTRWNSSYRMLARLVELQSPLQLLLADMTDKERKTLELPSTCWETAKQLLSILRKVDSVTTHLGGEKYSTLSWYLPLLTGLKAACINDDDSDDDEGDDELLAVSSLKKRLHDRIEHRFNLNGLHSDSLYVLAAVLDPRFRDLKYSPQQRDSIEETLVHEATIAGSSEVEPPTKRKPAHSALDDLLGCEDDTNADSVIAEVTAYLNEKPAKRSIDPLEWWAVHTTRFPRLALLAKKYLCVPATSVPSERVFSFAGIVVDRRRCQLSHKMIDALIFLHMNASLLKLVDSVELRSTPAPKPLFDPAEEYDMPALPDLPSEAVSLD